MITNISSTKETLPLSDVVIVDKKNTVSTNYPSPKDKIKNAKSCRIKKDNLNFNVADYQHPVLITEFHSFMNQVPFEDREFTSEGLYSLYETLNFFILQFKLEGLMKTPEQKKSDCIIWAVNELQKIFFLTLTHITPFLYYLKYYESFSPNLTTSFSRNLLQEFLAQKINLAPLYKVLNEPNSVPSEKDDVAIRQCILQINHVRKSVVKFILNSVKEVSHFVYIRRLGLVIPEAYPEKDDTFLLKTSGLAFPATVTGPWEDSTYIKFFLNLSAEESLKFFTYEHREQLLSYKKTFITWLSTIAQIQTHAESFFSARKEKLPPYTILKLTDITTFITSKNYITVKPSTLLTDKTLVSNNQFSRILLVLDSMSRNFLLTITRDYCGEINLLVNQHKT